MIRIVGKSRKLKRLSIYLAGFFLAFHYVLVIYVNSSFLKQFLSIGTIGFLYIIGALLSIILFIKSPVILNKIGNFKTSIIFILLELIATFGIASFHNQKLLIIFFLIHQAAMPLIFFSLDIFLEHEQGKESETGGSRGTYLTFQNVAWISAPILAGFIGKNFDLPKIYLLSSLFIFPLLLNLSLIFKNYEDKLISKVRLIDTWHSLKNKIDIKRVLFSSTLLQFFYAVMVIYLPILLFEKIGFEWNSIGALLTIMLLPFLILELPLGYISDKKIGEKEIMIFGFIIVSITTFSIFFIHSPNFLIWALILFATRVGASSIEISNESYFFKQVKDRDANVISLFRITRPLAYVLAPLFVIPMLSFVSYSSLFGILGLITLFGLFFIPRVDTK